jgi:glycosyltransferase involved in cell wall biosynthesis
MACGTPVVTTNRFGMSEIAGDAALLVDADDPGDIAAAVLRIVGDEALRESLSLKALKRSERFSWDRCATETLGILTSLVEE